AKDRGQVVRNSSLADIEPLGNLLIFQSLTYQFNHFLLPSSDGGNFAFFRILRLVASVHELRKNAFCSRLLKPEPAACHLTDRHWNITGRFLTMKNSLRSTAQRFFQKIRILSVGQ